MRSSATWDRVVGVIGRGADAPPALAELDRLCRSHISGYKCPKEIQFMAAIPKNHYGEIDKKIFASFFV